ncbi:unnamed protein product [Lymnaea stagnalis]|uniref:Microtubule-associated protein 9 n=1 Tax=Lymnaea stagnalis TaxID=6523 RepID=A0AAV2H3G4_LYMST
MDVIDAVPRPRRERPKDSFQSELKAKLRQRKSVGLAADVTDSDDDGFNTNYDYQSNKARPGSAKRRADHSPDLGYGLGTTTMRSKDLKKLIATNNYEDEDDDDEEVMAATSGKIFGGSWQPSGVKSPSPRQESKFLRKNTKDQSSTLDSLFGRKTPTYDSLSKEEIIFGRKTPIEGKKSPSSGSSMPGMDKQWQPPSFRSASPGITNEQNKGSPRVTPTDSLLESISETPREKMTPRLQRGQKPDTSPRQTSFDAKPKPQARNKDLSRTSPANLDVERLLNKTPTLGMENNSKRSTPTYDLERNTKRTTPTKDLDQSSKKTPGTESILKRTTPTIEFEHNKKRTTPTFEDESMKRTTPTLDLFGRTRAASKEELDSYITRDKDVKKDVQKQPSGRSPSPEMKPSGLRSKTSEKSTNKVSFEGKKSPSFLKTVSTEKKFPEKVEKPQSQNPSLFDLVTGTGTVAETKPQAKSRKSKAAEEDSMLDDIFGSGKKTVVPADGRKSPGTLGRKTPEVLRKSLNDVSNTVNQPIYQQQKPDDTSSLCEELPPDPNRKSAAELSKAEGEKHKTERARQESFIDTVAGAQTMEYIAPAKKIRPVTASAKVKHRPTPRYGTLPGQTATLTQRQFNSTGDIRDAVYEEWYKEHVKAARQRKKVEERKAKEEEEKKMKEKERIRLEAEASYKSWAKTKKEISLTEREKREQEEALKKQKEEQEKEQKILESQKSFESWRKKKESVLKKEQKKKEALLMQTQEEKEREKREKEKDRKTAFNGWERKKKQDLLKQINQKKSLNKSAQQLKAEEQEALRKKEEEAIEQYNNWLEEKEKQAKKEKQRKMMEDEFKPAWFPASRTIPFGR